jgi:hypothetical protein
MTKLSASVTIFLVGLSFYRATILPFVGANKIYLRNPQNICSARTCSVDTDRCADGWKCYQQTNTCEYPHCIMGGYGCDQDSSDTPLHCCPGRECLEHPTGQSLGYCGVLTPSTPTSTPPNSDSNRAVSRPAALNPNNCPEPLSGYHNCGSWGTLTICCSAQSSWYSCDGQCYSSSNVATVDE